MQLQTTARGGAQDRRSLGLVKLEDVRVRPLGTQTGTSGISVVPVADVNSCAAQVNAFTRTHAAKWEGRGGMIPLSLGDLKTGNMPDAVVDAHDQAFRLHRDIPYAPIPGNPDLRSVVAKSMQGRFGVPGVLVDHVLPIPGSRFGEFAFLDTFYRSFPDLSVLIVDPCWATGPQQALHLGGPRRVVEAMMPYDPRGLFARLTPSMLADFLDQHPNVGAVLFTNPNNPVGHLTTDAEMFGFAELFARRRLFVLEDMTYGYVSFGHDVPSLQRAAQSLNGTERATLLERTATILGLQKLVGSGFRVSAVVSQGQDLLRSLTGLLSFTSGPVNNPAQVAAAVYYSDEGTIDGVNADLKLRRHALARSLEQARVRLHERHGEDVFEHTLRQAALDPNVHGGGYYSVLRLNSRAIARICESMGVEALTSTAVMEFFAREVGTSIQPGATMRLDDAHLRLAFGAANLQQIDLLGDRLTQAFA